MSGSDDMWGDEEDDDLIAAVEESELSILEAQNDISLQEVKFGQNMTVDTEKSFLDDEEDDDILIAAATAEESEVERVKIKDVDV